jgi:mRNA-degrading endonuclease toxin of MazEF toxin-antitoxin module
MTEKIVTVDKRELGERIGKLMANQMKDIADQKRLDNIINL